MILRKSVEKLTSWFYELIISAGLLDRFPPESISGRFMFISCNETFFGAYIVQSQSQVLNIQWKEKKKNKLEALILEHPS